MKYTQVNNKQKMTWTKNLKVILDQAKQLIDADKYEHPTGTLSMTFYKAVRGSNLYVWIG